MRRPGSLGKSPAGLPSTWSFSRRPGGLVRKPGGLVGGRAAWPSQTLPNLHCCFLVMAITLSSGLQIE